ncbi:MAG: DUF3592 domain-containing protein [Terracidiphilus sp.]|jgi:hypothetical protein
MDQVFKVIGYVALCASPCLIVCSFICFFLTRSFLLRSIEVEGKILRLERSKDYYEFGHTFAPVFTFAAVDGTKYTVTSNVGSDPPGFTEGQSVRVRYKPECPENARINTFFQIWGTVIGFGYAGMFCLFFGCYATRIFNFAK